MRGPPGAIEIFVAVFLAIVLAWFVIRVLNNVGDNECIGLLESAETRAFGCTADEPPPRTID